MNEAFVVQNITFRLDTSDGSRSIEHKFTGDCTGDEFIERVKEFMLAVGYHPDTVNTSLGFEE